MTWLSDPGAERGDEMCLLKRWQHLNEKRMPCTQLLKSFPLSFHLHFKNSVDDNAEGEEEEVFGVKQ